MIEYVLSGIIFLFLVVFFYLLSSDKKKNEPSNIFLKNLLPAILTSVIVFVIIKYYQSTHEPVMMGNYFDTIS